MKSIDKVAYGFIESGIVHLSEGNFSNISTKFDDSFLFETSKIPIEDQFFLTFGLLERTFLKIKACGG